MINYDFGVTVRIGGRQPGANIRQFCLVNRLKFCHSEKKVPLWFQALIAEYASWRPHPSPLWSTSLLSHIPASNAVSLASHYRYLNLSVMQQCEYSIVSDVVEKTSTRRRSRMPCVVVEKITTRWCEGVGVVVEKNEKSGRTFNKNSCDLLTAITHTEILVARCIFLIKSESVSD